jgi:hypothetical protein
MNLIDDPTVDMPRWALIGLALAIVAAGGLATGEPRELRVCADPDNLPFSNVRAEGFGNKIAALIAEDLHASVAYNWNQHRTGATHETTKSSACDLVLGVPSGFEPWLSTKPHYSSTYVFVYPKSNPHAGFFAKHQRIVLENVPVTPGMDKSAYPFVYAISLGVRRGDVAFRQEMEDVLERRKNDIRKIIDTYGVPLVESPETLTVRRPNLPRGLI